jgi:diguanylate cyclase (GGDEF)-like protein
MEIPGLPVQAVLRDAVADERGVMWFASSNGLIRFDGAHWRIFTEADGLISSALDVLAQRNGEVWIGYRDALGLTRVQFDEKRTQMTHFSQQDGLSSKEINGLAFDHAGRLWVTTDNGADRLENGRWRHYGAEDGLIWDDENDRAIYVDGKDNIWIGTSAGLSRYAAPPFPIPDVVPLVVLTSIQVGSREFQVGDRPALSHTQNSILIRFSSLDFSSETRARFRYRLKGYETSWTETRERTLQYASLPAGQYALEVIAAGTNGVWSAVPAQFAFSVKPPWWLSWWFLASSLAAAVLFARAAWQFRVRALVARQQLLERQVAERTAELTESHRQLEQIAYRDTLTSLCNRRMFIDEFRARIKLAGRNGESFALMLIDLDYFKRINDTFGHDAGDAVLIEAAFRLRGAVRESDCTARLGGDEFAILLTSAHGSADIEVVCKRIIDAFVTAIPFHKQTLNAKCSIGVARFPEDGDTQDGLFKSADIALYDAKLAGRNTFHLYRSTDCDMAGVDGGDTAQSATLKPAP